MCEEKGGKSIEIGQENEQPPLLVLFPSLGSEGVSLALSLFFLGVDQILVKRPHLPMQLRRGGLVNLSGGFYLRHGLHK